MTPLILATAALQCLPQPEMVARLAMEYNEAQVADAGDEAWLDDSGLGLIRSGFPDCAPHSRNSVTMSSIIVQIG